jgi:hypothetical protein
MMCYDLNDIFTAELAESAEKNHIFVMPLRIFPLRALRSRAQRAVNLSNHYECRASNLFSIIP